MPGTLDELIVKIDSNIKGAMSGISKVEGSMNRLESSVGKSTKSIRKATMVVGAAFAAIGVVAGAAAIGLGAVFTKQASDMESYMDTLRVLEGSQEAAAEKMAWLLDFAKKTPFELPGLIEATVKLGAYGIEAEEVMQTLGDTAAVMGKPINQAVEALADAQTGEFERMKEFGIKAVVIAKANAEQLGATAEQVGMTALTFVDKYGKQQAKIIDRNNREEVTSSIKAIWNEKYAGAMETKSRSMQGMISNIRDTLYQGTMSIMGFNEETGKFDPGSLFDKARVGVKRLLDRINEIDFSALADKVEGVVNKIITIVSNLATELAPTFNNLKLIFNSIFGIVKDVFAIFSEGSTDSMTLAEALNRVTGALSKVFKWIDEHPKITKLIVAIGLAAVAFAYIVPVVTAVVGAISTVISVVASASAFFAAGGTIISGLGIVLAALGGPITIVIAAISILAAAWATNLFGIRDKTKIVFGWLKSTFRKVANWLIGAGESYINIYIKIYNKLVPILNKAGLKIEKIGELHIKRLEESVKDSTDNIEKSSTDMANTIEDETDSAKDSIASVAESYENLESTVAESMSGVTAATSAAKGIDSSWLAEGNFISGAGEHISKSSAIGQQLTGAAETTIEPVEITSPLITEMAKNASRQATQNAQLNITSILTQSLLVQRNSNQKLDMLKKLDTVSSKLDKLKIEVNNYITYEAPRSSGFSLGRSLSSVKSGV